MSNMLVRPTCRMCGKSFNIVVDVVGYHKWEIGEKYIQDALPMLTPEERELLISKTCGECWNKMWGEYDV